VIVPVKSKKIGTADAFAASIAKPAAHSGPTKVLFMKISLVLVIEIGSDNSAPASDPAREST